MLRIAYFGLDPSSCSLKGEIIHAPVIRTQLRVSVLDEIENALCEESYSHCVLTSPQAACFVLPLFSPFIDDLSFIFLGGGTSSLFRKTYPQLRYREALSPNAEGICVQISELLRERDSFIWPRSAQARPLIGDFAKEKGLRHRIFDLYDTLPNPDHTPLALESFDALVFTSPSCVRAFQKIYGDLPKGKKIFVWGAITKAALEKEYGGFGDLCTYLTRND